MKKSPLISILIPVYNNESYICTLIDSLLLQSYQNFEIILVDDYSSDNTIEKIKSYQDPRVKLIRHKWNKGINSALNTAFKNSKGDYISFAAGDDVVKDTYLENAIKIFQKDEKVGVLYTSLILIDKFGNIIKPQPLWSMQKKQSREDLLNEMFYNGNALLSPGMIIKRNIMEDFMPLDGSFSTYQDYLLHVNLLIRTEIGFFTTAEYYYRRHSDSLSVRRDSYWRDDLETPRLMNAFLQIKDLTFLKQILKNNNIDIKHKELVPYYLGISALCSKKIERQKWGYRILLEIISDEKKYEELNKLVGFSYKKLLSISRCLYNANKKNLRNERLRKYIIISSSVIFFVLLFLVVFILL